jgi:Ca-activated chloride channel homolog
MKWIKFISIYLLVLIAVTAFAQQERKFIRKGNKLFEKENFQESEIQYRKAIDKDKNSYNASFNIGDALYKQEKYEDATKQFSDLSSNKDISKDDKAKLYHNIGNSMLQNQKLKESIDAYKEALRNNPNDMDTKHNLAYAQKLMQQQQQQQQQDKQDENKDQNKDQKEDQQKQDQQDKQDKQDQQQQQQQSKISKEDAERLLQALANDEKKTQDKLKKEKAKAAKGKVVKEW